MRRRRRRRSNSRDYFTHVHQEAIVQYVLTSDIKEREKLYVTLIGPAFSEMVDKIVYTYKFTNLPNIDDLKSECKIWLTTILNKFDPDKGSKAFSYFSVITKNWFIHKVKSHNIKIKREICYEDIVTSKELEKMVSYNTYVGDREKKEFWDLLKKQTDNWKEEAQKPNEKKVVEAVRILLEEPEAIEIFNKKAIYLYLREITGLNTKQIVNSLNKIRAKYHFFKEDWDS